MISVVAPENFKEKQIHVQKEMREDVATDRKGTQSVFSRRGLQPSSCPVTLSNLLKFSLPLFPHLKCRNADNNTYFQTSYEDKMR